MKTSTVLGLFKEPLESSWTSRKIVVSYHGGFAIVSRESFDFRDSKPEMATSLIGWEAPNGTYFFRDSGDPVTLYTFMVKVYQEGHKDTEKAVEQAIDRMKKNQLFLGQVLSL